MLKSPRCVHIRSAHTDILLRFAFIFLPFLFQTTVNPKHLYLKCVHFASLSIFLSHLRQSAQISGNPTVHIFKTPVRLAEKGKRNDPWRLAFASSSEVISVRSYYLTSLVNLSFCGLWGRFLQWLSPRYSAIFFWSAMVFIWSGEMQKALPLA